ncbi:PQQ-binding-like beta-propeller repeat protein [Aliiglaciecola aliphaticivorans]
MYKTADRMILQNLLRKACIPLIFILAGCSGAISEPDKSVRHAIEGAYAADISVDNKIAVVSTAQQGVLVWDLVAQTEKFKWSHEGEGHVVNTVGIVHIAADSSYVVTADRDAFALWNLSSGEPEGFWRIDEASVRDIAVSNNGRGILVGRGNGKAMFFEPSTGRRLEFLGHQEKINSVDISPNGFYALTGGNDYVAYLWDTRSGQVVHRFTHSSRVTKVALDDAGRYAFTADSKRGAKIWDLQTGQEISQLSFIQRQKIFSAATFSEDGKYLATGSPGRSLNLWSVSTGSEIQEWRVTPKDGTQPQSAVVYAVSFEQKNQLLSESSSGLAEYWAIE